MTNLIFNTMKGSLMYWGTLPGASDGLIAVPLHTTGLASDATMRDFTTLAAILGGTSTESNIGRITMSGVTVTVDQAGDQVLLDCADFSWPAATAGAEVGAIILCYVPVIGVSVDSAIVPISKHGVTFTPAGNDVNVTVATGGFASAS